MKHIPRKRFGQNFLKDNTVLDQIISSINPKVDDLMAEIGPGLGASTRFLVPRVSQLHVIELDRDLVVELENQFPSDKLNIHQGDVLRSEEITSELKPHSE